MGCAAFVITSYSIHYTKLYDLLAGFAGGGFPEVVASEWVRRDPGSGRGLYGSGVVVVNPPFRFAEEAAELGVWLETAGFGGSHTLTRFGE